MMTTKHTLVISFNQDNQKATDTDISRIVQAAKTSILSKNLDRGDVDILFSAQESPLARGFAEAFINQWQKDSALHLTLSQEVTHTTRTKAGQWRPGCGTEMGLLYYQPKKAQSHSFKMDKRINAENTNKGIMSIDTIETHGTKIKFCGAHLESRQPYQRVANISDWFHRHMAPADFLSFEQISDLAVDNIILAGDMNTRATYSDNPTTIASCPNHLVLPDRQTATHEALKTIGLKQHQADDKITYPVNDIPTSSWDHLDPKRRKNNECKGGDLDHVWCHHQSVARAVVNTESSDHEAVVALVATEAHNQFERSKQFIARVLSGIASDDVLTKIKQCNEQQDTAYLTNVYFYYTMIIKLNLQKLSLQSRGHHDESQSLQKLVEELKNHCDTKFKTVGTPNQAFLVKMKKAVTAHQTHYENNYKTHRNSTRLKPALRILSTILWAVTLTLSHRIFHFISKTKTTKHLDLLKKQLTPPKKWRSYSTSASFFSQKKAIINGTLPRHQSSPALLNQAAILK